MRRVRLFFDISIQCLNVFYRITKDGTFDADLSKHSIETVKNNLTHELHQRRDDNSQVRDNPILIGIFLLGNIIFKTI